VLIGLGLSGEFVLGEMVVHIGLRVAAQAVLDANLDPGVGENVLDAGARHRAGRESVAFDDNGNLRRYGLNIQCAQPRAIQYAGAPAEAAVGTADDPPTENVLPLPHCWNLSRAPDSPLVVSFGNGLSKSYCEKSRSVIWPMPAIAASM
jgi:hypothetical protein